MCHYDGPICNCESSYLSDMIAPSNLRGPTTKKIKGMNKNLYVTLCARPYFCEIIVNWKIIVFLVFVSFYHTF